MRREWILCVLLAASTLAVYWPVRHHEFILFDDNLYVTQNPYVQAGLTTRGIWYAATASVAENWHPLTILSHMLDCELFGANPGAHHLVNAALHIANALLLFLVLNRMTRGLWRSAVVAALFALHPLRVESVAWISERKDVLSGFFFMLTLWAYSHYAEVQSRGSGDGTDGKGDGTDETASGNPRPATRTTPSSFMIQPPSSVNHQLSTIYYLLSLAFFACGLMSKPMLVSLPFLLLLLDFWPLERFELNPQKWELKTFLRLLREKIPFFALSAALCWLTLRVQGARMAGFGDLSLTERAANAVVSYIQYLGQVFWPTRLAILYPHPAWHYPVSDPWPSWEVWVAALLLVAISALCLCQLRRRPFLAVGWFWYLGALVPVIGLVQVGELARADRYTYLPVVGFTLSVVWLCSELWSRGWGWKLSLSAMALAALGACAALTCRQIGYWRNSVILFEHTVEVTPDNPIAQCNLGYGLGLEGKPARAAVCYRAALAIDPRSLHAHFNLALLLENQERWPEAAEHYLAVTRLKPNFHRPHLALARILPRLGRTKDAAWQMEEFLRTCPRSALESPNGSILEPARTCLNNLAWRLAASEQAQDRDGSRAVRFAERACELTQYQVTVFAGTLAAAYAEAGRFDDAVATAEKACALAAQNGEQPLLEKNRQLLELYRARQPYHEREK